MATIELNDPYTGEWTVFLETTKTYHGADITDSMCDDIIYKKINDKYYRRVLVDDTVNVKWFGAKGDGTTDDSAAIQKAISSLHSVRFDPGKFIINTPISIPQAFSGLSIIGSSSDIWEVSSTILTTTASGTIFKGEQGLNTAKISNIVLDGKLTDNSAVSGAIAMDFTYGGVLNLDRVVVKNFSEYGLYSKEGLLRIENCYFRNNKIGAQIYSDSTISNSEFTEGDTPLRLVAGGNRLVNVWCNNGKVSCLDLQPLDNATGHQNTSITNLYIGEVKSGSSEGYAIRIIGNDTKRVQQVQISNSFFVHADTQNVAVNSLVYIDKADEIILNGINVLGQGLYATSNAYTNHFVQGINSNRITITSCVINGINKNAIYQGTNSYDWEIFNNTFNNCGDKIAVNDEGANIYVLTAMGRTSVLGNKFLISSGSNVPYAAYVTSVESLNWDNNFIAYPNAIIVKDPTYTAGVENNFSGSYYRNGAHFKTVNSTALTSSTFEDGYTRPTKNLRNAQFFYDNTIKKPIWFDAQNSQWKDSAGTVV
ncbi:glycosyl hydrolase family 28-related protein [Chryseobacterium sp.]|uniref:glycosyl hydrolase family 28-related protein n=1 Tax=Chryseobacterium sp. TaxID=1871047 RepID=UPI0033425EAB